jgi:hypothetical protein
MDALLMQRTPDLLHARILSQENGYGDRLVERVRERLAVPPACVPPDDWKALWAWSAKMRTRIRHPDPTMAAYYRADVLVESLPCWAQVRRRWFFGGKAALGEIRRSDPAVYAAYAAASAPDAGPEALDALLDRVFDPAASADRPPEGFARA